MGTSVFRVLGGSLLSFAGVWALVLGWWQSNGYQPGRGELAFYLGALPLTLVGGYYLLRGVIVRFQALPPSLPAAAPQEAEALAGADRPVEAGLSLYLLAAFLCTPAGNSANELLAAMGEGRRPAPGKRLLDADGFPVFVAEVADLDIDGVKEDLAVSAAGERLDERPELLRALALVERILPQAGAQVLERLAALPPGEHVAVQVLWLIPVEWNPADLPLLQAWLRRRLRAAFGGHPVALAVLPAASEAEALGRLDEVVVDLQQAPAARRLLLLLAAASAIDAYRIENWASRQQLFSVGRQQGRMPGEGAVALLLVNPVFAAQLPLDDTAVAVLGRVGQATRDKPVAASGRVDGRLIADLIAAQLQASGLDGAAIRAAVLDTDHRAGPLAEALDGLAARCGELDPIADCPAIGSAIASLPPVGSLVALACAAARAQADGGPVLCISNQAERERAVLLLRPLAPVAVHQQEV